MNIKLHERVRPVSAAKGDIERAFLSACTRHDVTGVEGCMILTEILQRQLTLALRMERHGDAQTPAGEARD